MIRVFGWVTLAGIITVLFTEHMTPTSWLFYTVLIILAIGLMQMFKEMDG